MHTNHFNKVKMMNKTHKIAFSFLFVGAVCVSNMASAADKTLSLKNLERERAAMIQDLLNPKLSLDQRLQQLAKRQRHLTDMERMVMRDERLMASKSRLVKQAFENYESTFLVHAGAEQKRSASEQWLANIKLSNKEVLNAKAGFRK